ncbi:uncharacterized protein LOC143364128 [Halictus rubicundus]|uniref:uncharacterized protein LOC143364128 n=1 Tax=Halictus rubicundus TaxID=77578 RepID=UPI0040374375
MFCVEIAIKGGENERKKETENSTEKYGTNTNESRSRRPPSHTTGSRKTIELKLNVQCFGSPQRKYKIILQSLVGNEIATSRIRNRCKNQREIWLEARQEQKFLQIQGLTTSKASGLA